MLRAISLGFILSIASSPAWALCGGASYFDQLSAAQQDQLAAETSAIRYGQGLTWTATKGEAQLTIAGTMHIFDQRLQPILDTLRPAIQTADLILLEATPREEHLLQAAIGENPDTILIETGPTLPELLDEATWERVKIAAQDQGIPAFIAAKFEPWYMMMTLAIPTCAMEDLTAGKQGLDHMIMREANIAGVGQQALEPFDTLFTIMQSDDIDTQLQMLKLSLMSPQDQQATFVALLDSYFAQDVGRLIALNRVIAEETPDMDAASARAIALKTEDAIIGARNRAWMPVINAALVDHKTIVVAVGAAHLPDRFGLLNLLAGEGWTLKRF